jgi:hypothetical protein
MGFQIQHVALPQLGDFVRASANRQKKEHITCEYQSGDSDVFPSHLVPPRTNRFILMMKHNFAEFSQELCSSSSSLSANKVSSQLIFRLDQAIASRLLFVVIVFT